MDARQTTRLIEPLRLLVIDDEPSVHAALRAIFAGPGFAALASRYPDLEVEMACAHSIHDGVNVAIGFHPKCILLDLCLDRSLEKPVEATLYCIPQLAARWPVIVMTGFDSDDNWGKSISGGALNFLQKQLYMDPRNVGFLYHAIMNAILLHRVRPL